jgi:hypothetical protein
VDKDQTCVVVIEHIAVAEEFSDPDKHPEDWDIGKNDWQHIASCEKQQDGEVELKFIASNNECNQRTKEESQDYSRNCDYCGIDKVSNNLHLFHGIYIIIKIKTSWPRENSIRNDFVIWAK